MAATRTNQPNWLKLLGNALFLPASAGVAGVQSLFANEFGGDTRRRKEEIADLRTNQPDNAFLQSLTDDELLGMFEQYGEDRGFGDFFMGNDTDFLGTEDFLADLQRVQEAAEDRPEDLNREDINARAAGDISLDDARARQFAQEETGNLQKTYDVARQDILGSQAEQNKATLGEIGSQMEKGRMGALEAGASAGLRLANNVNVLLSAQNKQRSTSLDTANNLTQMLLNQQNQAMGLRKDVNDRDATRAQRTTGYQQQQYDKERNIYNQELGDWQNRYSESTKNVDPSLRDAYTGFTSTR
jgi:hypothetical protein